MPSTITSVLRGQRQHQRFDTDTQRRLFEDMAERDLKMWALKTEVKSQSRNSNVTRNWKRQK
jgi:hypothetical protein